MVLQRIGKKANATTNLDLFDEASLLVETSNQGRTYFLREARVITRQTAIGRSYDALRFASALAMLITRNTVHEDSRAGVATLLREAFAAFGASARPDIAYFKSLYRFARDEGYPVKEQWFPTLAASDRAEVSTLLNRPLTDQTAATDLVAQLQHRFEEYLQHETEIIFEAK